MLHCGTMHRSTTLRSRIPAVFSLYFDWFSSFMQAFIFCMLTMMYIAAAADAN